MSEYANLVIGKLVLFSFRNYVSSDIVSNLFCKGDLQVTPNFDPDPEDEDAECFTQYIYRTTVQKAKERLDAQGFSLSAFERLFSLNYLRAIDYSSFLSHLRIYDEHYDLKGRMEKNVSFKKWKNAIEKIIKFEVQNGKILWSNYSEKDVGVSTECDKVIFYSIADSDSESFYGIDTSEIDVAYVLRLILECCDEDLEIFLDFSYIQFWADDCIPKALSATENVKKSIVLLEGTSDKDILEFAISKLYPHLSDLFYFMDFDDENGKRDGGTSFAIKNLKTFYFSKIKINFIAIFDNDAEGYQSKCTLLNEIKNWPSNFKILTYPETPFFRSYPTLAPNGSIIRDDINKRAASIELYLPNSFIQQEGMYLPIEWESRKKIKNADGKDEALYQGVISEKDKIKQAFHSFKNKLQQGQTEFNPDEWERMKCLLEAIVFAYR